MQLKAWAHSDVGNVRDNNEDNSLVDVDHGVFLVADGVGGRDRGEVASAMVVDGVAQAASELRAVLEEADAHDDPVHRERILNLVRDHLTRINADIFAHDRGRDDEHGMATTADLLLIGGAAAYVGHVGDSRVYLLRDDRIFRITEDHTYAERLRRDERSGVRRLADSNAKFEHMLTRSMGGKPHVEVDTLFLDVQDGDRFVLCTDGLTDYLSGQDVLELASQLDGEELVNRLVAEAKERGGHDNITVVVVDVEGTDESSQRPTRRSIDTIRQVNFLEQIELFDGLTARELIKVLRTVYERTYMDGDVILRRGDGCDALFLIVEGSIALLVDGTEVARLEAGQHFGELALFSDEETRIATAVSVGDSLLLSIPADKFMQLVGEEVVIGNKLLMNLVKNAATQMRATNERLAASARADTLRTFVPPQLQADSEPE
jgi:PPM family protein phosphatase